MSTNLAIASVPLFSFDFKYDSLQQFLDNLSNIVNQHANLINSLQTEMSKKSSIRQVKLMK